MSRAVIKPEALTRTSAEIECFVSYPDQDQREFEVIERRGGQTVLDVGTNQFLTFDDAVVEIVADQSEGAPLKAKEAPAPKPKPAPKKATGKRE